MSVRIQSLVWASALARTDGYVMLAIADNADDEGNGYPSIAYLAWKTGLSCRTVQRVLRRFRDSGYIEGDTEGGDQSTHYKILVEKLPMKQSWQRLKGRDVGRSGREATGCQDDAPSGSTGCHPRQHRVTSTTAPGDIHDATGCQMRPRNKEEPSGTIIEPSGMHHGADAPTLFPQPPVRAPSKEPFAPPTVEEVAAYCLERGNGIAAEYFHDYYETRGWKVGGRSAMRDWRAAVRTWEHNGHDRRNNGNGKRPNKAEQLTADILDAAEGAKRILANRAARAAGNGAG